MNIEDKPKSKTLLRQQAGAAPTTRTKIGPPESHGTGTCDSPPKVSLKEVDGVVEAIEVHCACGEQILIRCHYE